MTGTGRRTAKCFDPGREKGAVVVSCDGRSGQQHTEGAFTGVKGETCNHQPAGAHQLYLFQPDDGGYLGGNETAFRLKNGEVQNIRLYSSDFGEDRRHVRVADVDRTRVKQFTAAFDKTFRHDPLQVFGVDAAIVNRGEGPCSQLFDRELRRDLPRKQIILRGTEVSRLPDAPDFALFLCQTRCGVRGRDHDVAGAADDRQGGDGRAGTAGPDDTQHLLVSDKVFRSGLTALRRTQAVFTQ